MTSSLAAAAMVSDLAEIDPVEQERQQADADAKPEPA